MRPPRAHLAIAAAFFIYVVWMRTHDVADSFLMLGEQIRDWTIALGAWHELPLTGAPSTAGGRGFGPVYYWILWIGRVLIGPFTGNLPHAGGITVALTQSIADTLLLWVLCARVGIPLALATCLYIASAPFDISISSVIWNPPVAAALVKIATAMALAWQKDTRMWPVAVTAAVAWLAVQAHSSAIFVAAPVMAAAAVRPLIARQWRRTIDVAAVCLATIMVLQIPYVVAQLRAPEPALGPAGALESLSAAGSFRLTTSYGAVVNTTGDLLVNRSETWRFQLAFLVVAAVVAVRWRKDPVTIAVSIGPIVAASLLFALWTRPYDSYWFLSLTTAMALTFGLAIAAMPWPRVVTAAGAVALLVVASLQLARIAQSKLFFSYPQYRAMRVGSTELARQSPELRDIGVTFDVHPTMDKYFIYRILGGRIDAAAPHTGFIDSDGTVRIE